MDTQAAIKCKKCNKHLSIRNDDVRWLTIKCNCKMIIIYPSGIITEIKREDYVKHTG